MLLLVILALTLLVLYVLTQTKRPPNFPPGPQWLPIVGNQPYVKSLAKKHKGLHMGLNHLSEKYNSPIIGLKMGTDLAAVVFDQELINAVLTRDVFVGRPDNFFFKLRTFGRRMSGITGSEGIVWSTNRTFVVRHLKALGFGKSKMEALIRTETDDIIRYLKAQKFGVHIGHFFAIRVLNVLWTLICGKRLNGKFDVLQELLGLFSRRGKLFDITGGLLNIYPWLRFVAPEWSGYNLVLQINKKLKGLIGAEIKRHYDSWEEGKDDDLMYCYISEIQRAQNGSVFCEDELMVVCFDLFIAGAQTTSGTLELLVFQMILNPDVQKKVHQEIDKHIDKNAELQYTDLANLPYIEAVIAETQRFVPVMPIIGPRRTLSDTTLGGYNIPKDTTIFINTHCMNRSEKYWNKPDTFNPERFLNADGTLKNLENVLPFGLGKRRCLGDVLAKQCIFYFFVEIMRKFRIELSADSKPLLGNFSLGITLLTEDYKPTFILRE